MDFFTGGLGLDFGARKLGAMAIPMSAGNTKRQLMCMEDFGATAFACTPSYALYLGEAAKEAGVVDRLQLKVGINGAEPWTDEMRRKIEELLNVNSFDIYGLCEITYRVLHLTAFITKVCMCKRIISIRKS